MNNDKNLFSNFKIDLSSGLVVFLVALPLCLGIALASDVPPIAGLISGVIGGIIVGSLSNSGLSVTGPAAGLTAIVAMSIVELGGFEIFLVAVVLAGLMQIAMGYIKAGTFSNYFPSSVIEGMLTAIGVIIILKQIPHAFGYDIDNEGDFAFIEKSGHSTLDTLMESINFVHFGALIIAVASILILIFWDKVPALKKIKTLPAALIVVVFGILMNEAFIFFGSNLAIITDNHLVSIPSLTEIKSGFALPDLTQIMNPKVWTVAATIAIVASIETLLCIEATDKLDPWRRYTDTNRELKAQGLGNLLSGLLGGLPMTSVVVRSSANINAGGKTKVATITHGLLLAISVIAIPFILNKIPLATLAAILLVIGYKLAKPATFKHMWNSGYVRFVPFIVTVLAVVFTDLLKGVGIGMVVAIFFILYENMKVAYSIDNGVLGNGDTITIKLAQEVSFLNKAAIKNTLGKISEGSSIVLDASNTNYIDFDVLEIIRDFSEIKAKEKNIKLELKGFKEHYEINNTLISHIKVSHTR